MLPALERRARSACLINNLPGRAPVMLSPRIIATVIVPREASLSPELPIQPASQVVGMDQLHTPCILFQPRSSTPRVRKLGGNSSYGDICTVCVDFVTGVALRDTIGLPHWQVLKLSAHTMALYHCCCWRHGKCRNVDSGPP